MGGPRRPRERPRQSRMIRPVRRAVGPVGARCAMTEGRKPVRPAGFPVLGLAKFRLVGDKGGKS